MRLYGGVRPSDTGNVVARYDERSPECPVVVSLDGREGEPILFKDSELIVIN
jgi:hypothetical protein